MQYRGIEYQVVQTANPTGWKWTIQFDSKRVKTGAGYNRTSAIALAQRAIDKALAEPFPNTDSSPYRPGVGRATEIEPTRGEE
jgi:hypothetical protein